MLACTLRHPPSAVTAHTCCKDPNRTSVAKTVQLSATPRRVGAPPRPRRHQIAAASTTASSSDGGVATAAPKQPPPLPPYSTLSTPVYSLSTAAPDGSSRTLNLVTYAGPVSLAPRHYAIGLYNHTLSRDNFLATGRGLLQARRAAARRGARARRVDCLASACGLTLPSLPPPPDPG